uniref:ANK_REP_REGION domain-containing protein n=1 Tax=Panagrolaimus sp. JU765 TaxID=591449 RepID=A0AC34RFA8_9BILA
MGRIFDYPTQPRPDTALHVTRSNEFLDQKVNYSKEYYSATLPTYPRETIPLSSIPLNETEIISTECCSCPFRMVKNGHLACLQKVPKEMLYQVDIENRTMLHLAIKHGHVDIVDYLLEKANDMADIENNLKETPLLIAAANGRPDLMDRLLKAPLKICIPRAMHRDINGTSCLMAAVTKNDNDTALWLLRRFGRQLAMLPNESNLLPIHIAALNGNLEFIRIVTKYDQRMANYKDKYGCTPSTYAAQGGNLDCLRYLIEKARADISVLTAKGQSLLHVAALSGHVPIIRWLRTASRSGSDAVLWPTYDKANVIHCAAFGGHIPVVKLLLDLWPKKRRKTILAMGDSRGNTALHLAVINNQLSMVKYLIEVGASITSTNFAGQTAEQIAIMRGYTNIAQCILFSGKHMKKNKKFSHSCSDLVYAATSSALLDSQHFPNNSFVDTTLSGPKSYKRSDTLDSSSGFLSGGDESTHNNLSSTSKKVEISTQTEAEHFTESKVSNFNTDEWHGEALAAVEEIDKVLDALGD